MIRAIKNVFFRKDGKEKIIVRQGIVLELDVVDDILQFIIEPLEDDVNDESVWYTEDNLITVYMPIVRGNGVISRYAGNIIKIYRTILGNFLYELNATVGELLIRDLDDVHNLIEFNLKPSSNRGFNISPYEQLDELRKILTPVNSTFRRSLTTPDVNISLTQLRAFQIRKQDEEDCNGLLNISYSIGDVVSHDALTRVNFVYVDSLEVEVWKKHTTSNHSVVEVIKHINEIRLLKGIVSPHVRIVETSDIRCCLSVMDLVSYQLPSPGLYLSKMITFETYTVIVYYGKVGKETIYNS